MEYSLYVYGGGEILWSIFNGIAMLFKTDNPYFTKVGGITAGIGILYVAAQAVPRASLPIFFKSWFLPTFLLVALFYGPKSSVHIIDKADADFRYNKVDNIPIGIAAVASLSTNISEYLTEAVETLFSKDSAINDGEKFSKVGTMFGARLINAANTLTIKDPLMKENLKDFTRQCFAWPYVFSNIAPGKKAALETQDMLGFIAENPHPLLGVYWREPGGTTTFKNCVQCVPKVRAVMAVEVNQGLTSLAQSLFGSKIDSAKATQRLNQYFGDAWGKLSSGARDSATIIQQELMLNSYREALQDKRDELGLARSDIEMAHINAARGIAQQNSSFLVKAAMSGTLVPVFHTIIFALAMIYFSIMAPMTFLPRGTMLLVHWVKVMMYLATWPVLFAILNCLGQMFAARAAATKVIGYGEGLNILTQTGLADIAQTAYITVIGLQLSVPFLAWTLLWGGGYAFSQMASSFTQGAEGFAGKTGAETVDGNVAFDTQSLHTRSIANTQMAQQQLGASFNYGSRFDDGKVALLHGTSGTVVAQEHQHNFGTNLSHNDVHSQMLAYQSSEALQAAQQEGLSLQRSVSRGSQEMASFAKSVAESKGINESFGGTESANLQQQMQNLKTLSERIAEDHGLRKDVAFDALVEASVGAGFGLTGPSLGINGNARGSMKAGAADTDAINKALSSEKGAQFTEGLNQAMSYAKDHKAAISKNFNTQSLDQAQTHFSKAEAHADNVAANLSKSKSYSAMASHSRQQGTSATTNTTDFMVGRVASQFNVDRAAAAQYLAYHPEVSQQVGSSFINQKASHTNNVGSQQDVYEAHIQNQKSIGTAPDHNPEMEAMRRDHNIGGHERSIDQDIFNARRDTQAAIKESENITTSQNAFMDNQHKAMEGSYAHEKDKTLVGKTISKADKNLKGLSSNQPMQSVINKMQDTTIPQGTPVESQQTTMKGIYIDKKEGTLTGKTIPEFNETQEEINLFKSMKDGKGPMGIPKRGK